MGEKPIDLRVFVFFVVMSATDAMNESTRDLRLMCRPTSDRDTDSMNANKCQMSKRQLWLGDFTRNGEISQPNALGKPIRR